MLPSPCFPPLLSHAAAQQNERLRDLSLNFRFLVVTLILDDVLAVVQRKCAAVDDFTMAIVLILLCGKQHNGATKPSGL
jgi:uncharacterized membrane protein YdbT with pleckstrin-like domain